MTVQEQNLIDAAVEFVEFLQTDQAWHKLPKSKQAETVRADFVQYLEAQAILYDAVKLYKDSR